MKGESSHPGRCHLRQVDRWRSELAAIGETGFQRYLKEAMFKNAGYSRSNVRENWNILLMKVFLKWGYPEIIHLQRIFHQTKHPAIGVPP